MELSTNTCGSSHLLSIMDLYSLPAIERNGTRYPLMLRNVPAKTEHQAAKKTAKKNVNRGKVSMEEPSKARVYTKEEDILRTDILFGRGGRANNHLGNKLYRSVVWAAQPRYKDLCEFKQKKEKRNMSRSILLALQEHGCRFLQKDSKSKMWYEVPVNAALDKISQALRDPKPQEKREKKRKFAEAKEKSRMSMAVTITSMARDEPNWKSF